MVFPAFSGGLPGAHGRPLLFSGKICYTALAKSRENLKSSGSSSSEQGMKREPLQLPEPLRFFWRERNKNHILNMAKERYLKTKFWSDGYIVDLDPLERYLFLYFLTNEHTNIAGIYELPISVIERETKLSEKDKDVKKRPTSIIKRLGAKIKYIDGWVFIINFIKNQSTASPKVAKGIEFALDEIPNNIQEKIKEINKDIFTKKQVSEKKQEEKPDVPTYRNPGFTKI